MRRKMFLALVLAVAILAVYLSANDTKLINKMFPWLGHTQNSSSQFDKTKYSINDPKSIWFIVNKKRPLPASYEPGDFVPADRQLLRKEAAANLADLIKSARDYRINFKIISGYRSYATQKNTYNSYLDSDGRVKADIYSARPGHSEHQSGLAVDLGSSSGQCELDVCFGTTAGGIWLSNNAYRFGFIIRYKKDKESLTGYQYEPWHIRYVGKELAKELNKTGQTMEQFFGLPAATSY